MFLTALMLLTSCTNSLEETEYQKIRESNKVVKKIHRKAADHNFSQALVAKSSPKLYPWETILDSQYPYISKEFFRCKGSADHPSLLRGEQRIFDCGGANLHSLPLLDGKEFVYPILIELLNYVQKTLNAKVVVTCGHRCPDHNSYSDPTTANRYSKHMLAAEVDFYVEGYENDPAKVIAAIMQYYQKDPKASQDLKHFSRYTKSDTNVSTHPWYNQEVFVKLVKANEGRDFDNQHPYPYVSIQVRQDRDTNTAVVYSWKQAFYNYHRY